MSKADGVQPVAVLAESLAGLLGPAPSWVGSKLQNESEVMPGDVRSLAAWEAKNWLPVTPLADLPKKPAAGAAGTLGHGYLTCQFHRGSSRRPWK